MSVIVSVERAEQRPNKKPVQKDETPQKTAKSRKKA